MAQTTWHCQFCNLGNSISEDLCRSCSTHWKHAWKSKGRSTSRPKSQQRPRKEKQKQKEAQTPAASDFGIIPEKAPWVPHTPQARLMSRQVEIQQEDTNPPILPPQPVLPPPPAGPNPKDGLTQDEAKILTHLKALAGLGQALPSELQTQLQDLMAKEKETTPALSHGHLNKLKKIQNQLNTAAKRIVQVDNDWRNFVATVTQRVNDHASWYHAHRTELLTQYNQKALELEAARRELTQASQQLLEQQQEMPALPPPQDTTATLATVGQVLTAPLPEVVHLDTGDTSEVEENENMEDGDEASQEGVPKERKSNPIRPAAFQTRSPKKVANLQLKK